MTHMYLSIAAVIVQGNVAAEEEEVTSSCHAVSLAATAVGDLLPLSLAARYSCEGVVVGGSVL